MRTSSAPTDPFLRLSDREPFRSAQRAERTPYQVFCADGITYLGLRPPARTAGAPDPARSTVRRAFLVLGGTHSLSVVRFPTPRP